MENLEARFIKWFEKKYEYAKNLDKVKVLGQKKYLSYSEVAAKYCDLMTDLGEDIELHEVIEVVRKKAPQVNQGECQMTPVDFITSFIKNNIDNHKYKANANLTKISEITEAGAYRDITVDDVLNDILVHNDLTNEYKTDVLKRAFDRAIANFSNISLDGLISYIKYDESKKARTDEILTEIYNHLDIAESLDIFKVLMKHWLWQVKRYVTGKKVVHHIWLNFTGAQGLGKTTLIEKLCKPFSDYYAQCQVDILFDATREIKKLTDNFIISFDELACGSRSYVDSLSSNDMSMLKAILTQDELQTRIMGGQQQYKANRRFSCISSSNNHLYDTFYDPSSMRRYFDFNCKVARVDSYKHINDVLSQVADAWQGIDENLEDGYFNPNDNIGVQIRTIQSMYYPTNTTVHEWCVEQSLTEVDFTDNDVMKAHYDDYVQWCANNDINKHKNKLNFIDALKHYCKQKKKIAEVESFTRHITHDAFISSSIKI